MTKILLLVEKNKFYLLLELTPHTQKENGRSVEFDSLEK
eukprot:CAMPEP_0171304906 /NCGR_PEP_ID=MMETSP0816-20121228/14671_1 /TAXON_ID=420281 /ORGANISM="Proboscia inermis, Strain CCAP1064/1" /LENGTH=38 /DNA_ID= /DNA_START= /DNA_END= /DNA_ORIENTATION=